MTYFQFLLAFILPPILLLTLVQPRPWAAVGARTALKWLAVVALIALVYTTPWDNYLVWRGVWGYGAERVVGTLGYVPVEEYLFFLLQPLLTGLFFFLARAKWPPDSVPPPPLLRPLATAAWAAVAAAGGAALWLGPERWLYFGLILAWAAPALAGMTWTGAPKLWADRRAAAVALVVPTLYLWIADRTAIRLGIWDISDRYSVGLDPLGLPVEEATFFLLTNWLCVQGLAMFLPDPVPAPPRTVTAAPVVAAP